MTDLDAKADVHRYLRLARESMLWKLDGLDDYDIRRPLVPTGTNLLGLVKHLAAVEWGYFSLTFDRPMVDPPPWAADWTADEVDPNADMWATADESRAHILDAYARVCAHADTTIDELELDATGRVPWWPRGRREVTLHQIVVHNVAETNRHAGHADIVRELIDGSAGMRPQSSNLPNRDAEWWASFRDRLESIARTFRPA